MQYEKIAIIIPAYNPDERLLQFEKSLLYKFGKIIIVNDGSDEEYSKYFCGLDENTVLIRHEVNRGKGEALKTAFKYVCDKCPDIEGVVTADADGQHIVEDCELCAERLETLVGQKALVLGCRDWNNGEKAPLRSRLGNICTRTLMWLLFRMKITDTQTGLRAVSKELLYEFINITGTRYEYEMNMLMWCNRNHVEFSEVPINMIYEDDNKSSHFNPVLDSIRIYKTFLKYTLSSVLAVLIDYAVFAVTGIFTNNPWIMVAAGRIASSGINFYVNKTMVFKSEANMKKTAVKYFCLVVFSGVITAWSLSMLKERVVCNILFLKMIIETIMYFFNYFVQKLMIFVSKNDGSLGI